MSNPQPPAPASQGQPQQSQQTQLLKPEDLAKLQCLSDDQKQKYRPLLTNFWSMLQTKPAGSNEHAQASAKLREWSARLITQERVHRNKMKQQQQQPGQPSQAPQSQPNQQTQQSPQAQQASQQPQIASASDQQQQTPQQPPPPQSKLQPNTQPSTQSSQPQQQQQQGNRPPGAAQQNRPTNPAIMKHVESFPYFLPPGGPVPGSADAQEKISNMKSVLIQCLTKQEDASNALRSIQNMMQQRKNNGQDIPQEMINQRQQAQREYESAKRFMEDFKTRQLEWKKNGGLPAGAQASQQQAQGQQPQPQAQAQAQAQSQNPLPAQKPPQPVIKQEPQIKVEAGQSAPQFNNMQGSGLPQQNAQAITPVTQQQPRLPPAPHSQLSQQQASQQNQGFTQPGQHHQPPRPQINPQQANAHMQHQSNSPHPQSATSNPGGPPVPLSHQAAVSAAQRSYSNSDPQPSTSTPLQSGPGSFHTTPGTREREQLNNPKLPIPRQLNVTQPAPVNMGQARPTMSGPTNGAPGSMGQPVINKFPAFQLEGEGDRVLSKRKLDELVRQVTGGSEDALTPEVEEAMLQLADEFVDTVITSACKLSKLRESPNLEIRDLQLVLERNYNIRIPGYASDEVRTVRKLVPAPGWTQKMNAVQAAKVMGGKTDI